jgi:hypothetical protein
MIKKFSFDEEMKSYLQGKLSISEFLELLPHKTFSFTDKIVSLLEKAYIEKDPNKVEYLTIAASADGVSSKYSKIFCKLLKEEWHEKQEDIIMLLAEIKDPDTVDCISELVYHKMPWDSADYSSVGLKSIWALGAIGNDKAIDRLKELANSNVDYIRNIAEKQLQHMNKQ